MQFKQEDLIFDSLAINRSMCAGNLLTQSEKDECYNEIISLRAVDAAQYDVLGYNQLHWAVLCNQSIEEVKRLIEMGIGVNQGTTVSLCEKQFGKTPLHIAIEIGSTELVALLLKHGANQEYALNHIEQGFFEITSFSFRTKKQQASEYALSVKNSTFTFFDRQLVEQHCNKLSQDPRGYNSNLPTFFASCLYYSKQDELLASQKMLKVLDNVPVNVAKLQNLKNKYPAVEQDGLGEIYEACVLART